LKTLFYRKTGSFQKGWGGAYQTVIENIARYSKPAFVGKARVWLVLMQFEASSSEFSL